MNRAEIVQKVRALTPKTPEWVRRVGAVATVAGALAVAGVSVRESNNNPLTDPGNPDQNGSILVIPNPLAEISRRLTNTRENSSNQPTAVAAPAPEARPVPQATPESPLKKTGPEKRVNLKAAQKLNQCADTTKVISGEFATGKDAAGNPLFLPEDIDGVFRSKNLPPWQEQRIVTLFTAFEELTGITIDRHTASSRKTTMQLHEAIKEIKGNMGENTVLLYSYVKPETNRVEFVEAKIDERANDKCGAQAEEDGSILVGANSPTVITELEGVDENGKRYLVSIPVDARCGNAGWGEEYPKDTPTPPGETTIFTKTPEGTSTMTITSTSTATGTSTTITTTETPTNTPTGTETPTVTRTVTVTETPTSTETVITTESSTPTSTITTTVKTFTPAPSPTETETPPAIQTITVTFTPTPSPTETETPTGTWTATLTRPLPSRTPPGTPTPSKTWPPKMTITFTPRSTKSPTPTNTLVAPSPTPGGLVGLCITPEEQPADPEVIVKTDTSDPRGFINEHDLAIRKMVSGGAGNFCFMWMDIIKEYGVSEENIRQAQVIEVSVRNVYGILCPVLEIPTDRGFFDGYHEFSISLNAANKCKLQTQPETTMKPSQQIYPYEEYGPYLAAVSAKQNTMLRRGYNPRNPR